MRRRVIAGMGANSFGMAISIGLQLLSLPLFLHIWDTATYGVWLTLSAIPAYLSMADVGMVTAAGNQMTMAMGRGDTREANRIFQSAQLFMLVVCGALGLLVLPLAWWLPLPDAAGIAPQDLRWALALLCLGVLLSLWSGLAEAAFKSTERYASGTMLSNLTRLAEWLGMMLGLLLDGSFTAVAAGGLLFRALGVVWGSWQATRGQGGLQWGLAAADTQVLRSITAPALSFMAFPLANALGFQGITLLVAGLFGPASVAVFSTYRTLSRVAVQATAIFSHALWPEFSRLQGQGARSALQALFRKSAWLGLGQALLLSAVLYLLAPWLLQIWTHGAIAFVPDLMLLMLLYAAVCGSWHVPRVVLMATNQHAMLAGAQVVCSALALALAWWLGHSQGAAGVAAGMLLGELAIALVCLRQVLTVFHLPSAQAVAP